MKTSRGNLAKIAQKCRGNLLKGLSRTHYVRRHEVAMIALLCNTQYFYIVDGDMCLNNKQNTFLLVHHNNGYVNAPHGYLMHKLPMFFYYYYYYYYYYLRYYLRASIIKGHAVAQLVEALRYKPEGRGCDSRCSHWNFSLT